MPPAFAQPDQPSSPCLPCDLPSLQPPHQASCPNPSVQAGQAGCRGQSGPLCRGEPVPMHRDLVTLMVSLSPGISSSATSDKPQSCSSSFPPSSPAQLYASYKLISPLLLPPRSPAWAHQYSAPTSRWPADAIRKPGTGLINITSCGCKIPVPPSSFRIQGHSKIRTQVPCPAFAPAQRWVSPRVSPASVPAHCRSQGQGAKGESRQRRSWFPCTQQ